MARTPKEKRYREIVCAGLEHLSDQLNYTQNVILGKLLALKYKIGPASLSNIKNDNPVGVTTLEMAAKGIQDLMAKELGMVFDDELRNFRESPELKRVIIPEKHKPTNQGIKVYAAGRATVSEKTAFFEHAQHELVEVGIRLKSFSNYFISQNDSAYKEHILKLLQKGVHIKGYLLDPDCSEAQAYFDDRSKDLPSETKSIQKIQEVIEELRDLCLEFEALQLPGKFEIFLYRHIPYSLYLIVDGAWEGGKMMVSPYLYGIRRANCPVFEFAKKDQQMLFERYLDAYELFVKDARKLE